MYNLIGKYREIMLEKIKSYITYMILITIIFILFASISYSSLNHFEKVRFVLDNETKDLKAEVIYDNENTYISYEDIESFIQDDIFKESALKKIIITANNTVKVYSLNSTQSYTNFELDGKSTIAKYITSDARDYILLDEFCDIYGLTKVEDKELNIINVIKNDIQCVNLKFDREFGYVVSGNKFKRGLLDKDALFSIIKDSNYYDDMSDMASVIVDTNGNKKVVYVPKQSIDMEFIYNKEEAPKKDFNILVQNEDNLTTNKNYTTIITGFKLISNDGNVDIVSDIKKINTKCYVMITNGYRVSNYDSSITSYALQNMSSRENIIKEATNQIKDTKAEGIVINFRDFKVSSKKYFTQFVKEFSEYLHSYNKKLIVYIPIDASYIDDLNVLKHADNCIFIEYGLKSQNSMTSGADSPLYLLKDKINYLKRNNADINKAIMEIPLYSILWTEKGQKVIDVQYLYNSALDSFVSKNSLEPTLDEKSGQMYAEYQKGSLTYKIWLEDNYSLNEKIKITKENGCGGISLYKKGYEKNESLFEGDESYE